jgi:hypothetical protein
MSQFKDHESIEKHRTRELLFSKLPQLKKRNIRLLTLPSNNFIFEKMVMEHYPDAQIDCMELDKNLYNKMKSNLPVKVNYEFGDIFDKLLANPNTYDFIWLDLCGNLSSTNLLSIISSVQTSLKQKCIFAFTLSSIREQRTKVFTSLYNCKDANEFRFKVFPRLLTKLGRMFHPKFSLADIIRYKNGSNSIPMSLYLFKTF